MEKGYLLSGVDFLTASLPPDDGSKDHLLQWSRMSRSVWTSIMSSWVDRGTSSATKVPFGGGVSVRWDVVPHPERGRRSTNTTVAWRQIPRGSNRSRSSPQELPSLGNLGIGMGYLPDMVPGERVWLATSTDGWSRLRSFGRRSFESSFNHRTYR